MSSLLPIFLDLKDKSVLLIGGGGAALEKLEKLVKTGARVHVVAESISQSTQDLIDQHQLTWQQRSFQEDDLNHRFLIISAVNNPSTNRRIADLANQRGILINAVDEPAACDFYFAAQIERGPLQFAISSRGLFPGLARSIRLWLEEQFPPEITGELHKLVDIREIVKEKIPDRSERMQALRQQLQIWMHQTTSPKIGEKHEPTGTRKIKSRNP